MKVSWHYNDVIMSAMASQITSLTVVYSTVYSGADQRKHQNSASLAFVRGIHRSPVNSPYKTPVTRKMFPFDDVIMAWKHFPPYWHFVTGIHRDTKLWCFLWRQPEYGYIRHSWHEADIPVPIKLLNKQSNRWWFKTQRNSCDVNVMFSINTSHYWGPSH